MRSVLSALLCVLCALSALTGPVAAGAQPPPPAYRIIVHPKNPNSALERQFLEDAFLKKTTRWPNDEAIHPADLVPSSPVRRKFSEEVLRRSVEEVKSYWQQRIFSGRDVPPPEFSSDDEAVAYVLKHEGAVGYVSGTANVGSAKIVTVRW
jgi:ABC-type phosphate transport system substrate-binding protein